MEFKKATKTKAKLRMALIGPSGAGKTYSALNIARNLGDRVALIDTEHGSASKYADIFDFDTLELGTFSPDTYVQAIEAAADAGYDVLVIDSLSHAWMGKEGALEQVDKAAKRSRSSNNFAAWRDVTPMHNRLVEAILGARLHVIATMRSKMDYVQEKDPQGKTVIRKLGLAPVQRDGVEYEFDIVADMDLNLDMVISKTRCTLLTGGIFNKPGAEVAGILKAWLTNGIEPAPEPAPMAQPVEHKPESHTGPLPNGRPWDPEKLRSVVVERVDHYRGKGDNWLAPPPDALRGAMVGALDNILGGVDGRHTFLHVLFGDASSKNLDHAQVKVIMEWLASQAGPGIVSEEARRLVNAEMQAGAVGELFPTGK